MVFGVAAKFLGLRVWKAAVLGLFIGFLPFTMDVPTYVVHAVKCGLYSGVEYYVPHKELKGRPVVDWKSFEEGRWGEDVDGLIYYKSSYVYEYLGVWGNVMDYYDAKDGVLVAKGVGYSRRAVYYGNLKTWVNGFCVSDEMVGRYFQ